MNPIEQNPKSRYLSQNHNNKTIANLDIHIENSETTSSAITKIDLSKDKPVLYLEEFEPDYEDFE